MPYFIVYQNSAGDEVVKMVRDRGRLREAVDEAIEGVYLRDPIVKAYHATNMVSVNTDVRMPYHAR